MARHTYKPLWFFLTTLLSVFSICTIRIFDGFNWPFYAVTVNAVISMAGLVFHLHVGEETQKKPLCRVIRAALLLDSAGVFLMMGLSLFILTSQYHHELVPDRSVVSADQPDAVIAEAQKDVVLCETDDLYIYYTDYDDISFVAGERPSAEDQSILLCAAAAFQADYELGFSHDNIVGWHSTDGTLERGHPQDRLGAFTWDGEQAVIWGIDEAEEALRAAALRGGDGYQQFIVLHNGERGGHTSREFRCYRVLAILQGRACLIDSRTQMYYDDFIQALENLGIRDALYCDMGSGWNYSWYRGEDGKPVEIIGTPWPFSHNWIVFRKHSQTRP